MDFFVDGQRSLRGEPFPGCFCCGGVALSFPPMQAAFAPDLSASALKWSVHRVRRKASGPDGHCRIVGRLFSFVASSRLERCLGFGGTSVRVSSAKPTAVTFLSA